ncbi:MAG TPA: gephyrin-like molybdotransferase Glp [Polyangiaceae bacterium]|jgi:molybdopterin molybdotransferase|nr:gephyrin-like molybdotransferase Glp [Polyangiaceae bacterium]
MLPFDDALRLILESAPAMGGERIALGQGAGRVLAEELIAHTPLPTFDYSAMDGYAVASHAFQSDGPWMLPVRGESRAGALAPDLTPNSVCRIFTGAPIPNGADAVVMQEDVTRDRDSARFTLRPVLGAHIRRRGEDLAEGTSALARGTRLNAFQLGLAAALDRSELLVARRPRVTILCTGEELRAPGSPATPGSIPDSNGPSLAALVTSAGGIAELAPRTGDTLDATEQAIRAALRGSDLLLTVGGVSVGEHDLVREALARAGAQLEFWKVQIRPGKPLAFGRFGETRILGLPGNPVSAQLTFALFGMPLLRAMQGDRQPTPPRGHARLHSELRQKPGRTGFYRAVLDGDRAITAPNQASGSAASLAYADALLIVPADSAGFAAGDSVEMIRLAEL